MPGDRHKYRPPHRSLLERLIANSSVSDEHFFAGTPCWDWTGAVSRRGSHGQISIRICGKHHVLYAHRVAQYVFRGKPLYSKRKARHLCHRPGCINPMHTLYGSQKQNIRDQLARGTHTSQKKRRNS